MKLQNKSTYVRAGLLLFVCVASIVIACGGSEAEAFILKVAVTFFTISTIFKLAKAEAQGVLDSVPPDSGADPGGEQNGPDKPTEGKEPSGPEFDI